VRGATEQVARLPRKTPESLSDTMSAMAIQLDYRRPSHPSAGTRPRSSALAVTSLVFAALTAVAVLGAWSPALDVWRRPSIYFTWIIFSISEALAYAGAGLGALLAIAALLRREHRRRVALFGLGASLLLLIAMLLVHRLIVTPMRGV
jgi:hypothetical protein